MPLQEAGANKQFFCSEGGALSPGEGVAGRSEVTQYSSDRMRETYYFQSCYSKNNRTVRNLRGLEPAW